MSLTPCPTAIPLYYACTCTHIIHQHTTALSGSHMRPLPHRGRVTCTHDPHHHAPSFHPIASSGSSGCHASPMHSEPRTFFMSISLLESSGRPYVARTAVSGVHAQALDAHGDEEYGRVHAKDVHGMGKDKCAQSICIGGKVSKSVLRMCKGGTCSKGEGWSWSFACYSCMHG